MAGETIRGISVVIGSDTTGLTSALSDVNKASRNIQGELKQVEKLLKFDPTNTELLSQQQKLLADAVGNTKEKLDRLKAAQEQVNEQFANGQISEGAYRAFQREIAATEQQLRGFEGRLSSTVGNLDQLGNAAEINTDRLSGIGDKLSGVGLGMTAAITAPIVAAGGVMLKGAIDAETAQGKLQASLGITAEEAEKLGGVAQEVWKNGFGGSIEEASEALTTVKKNMAGLSETELKSVTEGAMTLADVFGADVADSSKAAGTMMKNFGISGQDAFDLITVGFQKGGDYSGELLDTLNEYAPQFASMGLSADQAMGILLKGAESGAFSLDKVGDAMKEFNIRAQDGSKSTAEGFAAIGLDAEKMGAAMAKGGEDGQKAFTATVTALAAMKNPIEQNAAGTALFGTQWEDVRANVITAMADGVKGIGEFKGSTEEAAAAMYENNPGIAITKAMRELQTAIQPALQPLADIITNTIVPAIKSMAEWFANLSPEGQKAALAIAGIVAAIGPATLVIGGLVTNLGKMKGAFSDISDGVKLAKSGMSLLLSPAGLALAAIAAIAAIAYLVIKNWEPIKEFFGNLWDGIKNTAASAWDSFKTLVTGIITGISDTFKNIFTGVKDFLTGIWDGIKTAAKSAWDGLGNLVFDILTRSINGWKKIFNILFDFFTELPGKLYGYGVDIIQGLIDGIQSMIANVSKIVGDLADTIKRKIKGALGINSPSKVMMEIGEFTGEGFIEGIKKTLGEVSRQAEKMANAAIPDVSLITKGLNNPVSVGNLSGSGTVLNFNISNNGTLVGSNGMNEFADIMSRKIAGSFGLGTGGDF